MFRYALAAALAALVLGLIGQWLASDVRDAAERLATERWKQVAVTANAVRVALSLLTIIVFGWVAVALILG